MALLSEASPSSWDCFLDPEVAEADRAEATIAATIAGSRRAGLTARALAALLGVAAVALLVAAAAGASAASLGRTPETSAAVTHIKATGSMQLVGTASAAPQISQKLNDYFDSEVSGRPVGGPTLDGDGGADGEHTCLQNEELHAGLCYKKCALLTGGTHPFRSSAWTCCKQSPCGLEIPLHDAGLCSGYDVSGDGESCPHLPGTCLEDEEMYLGICYKKCVVITNGEKPYRITPFTCCKTKGVACLNPRNSDSNVATVTALVEAHAPVLSPTLPRSQP